MDDFIFEWDVLSFVNLRQFRKLVFSCRIPHIDRLLSILESGSELFR